MSFLNDFIEKIAADIDSDKDKELIKRIQKTNNPMDWQKLTVRLNGIIQKGITEARVSTPNVPKNVLEAEAMKEFRRSVLNYDESSGNKPSSYIVNCIKGSLMKLRSEYMNETRMPNDVSDNAMKIQSVSNLLELELDRKPTQQEIVDNFQRVFGKPILLKDVKRVHDYTRNELSSNVTLGEDGEGETMTLGDVFNVGNMTGEEVLNAQREEEKLKKAMDTLTFQEKKLFKEYMGLDEYKNRKAPSFQALALNNNLKDAWQAQKMIREIERKIKERLR